MGGACSARLSWCGCCLRPLVESGISIRSFRSRAPACGLVVRCLLRVRRRLRSRSRAPASTSGCSTTPGGRTRRGVVRVPSLPPDEANAVVVGEIFGRLDATASLPRLREACAAWKPDVVVRESNEYGSAVAAELHGIPHARVAIGLSRMEELTLRIAANTVDTLRSSVGLSSDPFAQALRRSPYLTLFPVSLKDPEERDQPHTLRFHDPDWAASVAKLPDWWSDSEAPLLYLTLGSVAGAMEMTAGVYHAAMEAVAGLPVRVLLTGRARREHRRLRRGVRERARRAMGPAGRCSLPCVRRGLPRRSRLHPRRARGRLTDRGSAAVRRPPL
jgi:hypothetical protein